MINQNKHTGPLISVIIPVYNSEKYLLQCYDSLAAQEYENLQFIFVDDCSQDGSYEMLKSIQEQDRRVIVCQTDKNSGVSAARNKGLQICTGEYVGFCDSDDRCLPSMFSNMMKVCLQKGADISCCGLQRVCENGRIVECLWECSELER